MVLPMIVLKVTLLKDSVHVDEKKSLSHESQDWSVESKRCELNSSVHSNGISSRDLKVGVDHKNVQKQGEENIEWCGTWAAVT